MLAKFASREVTGSGPWLRTLAGLVLIFSSLVSPLNMAAQVKPIRRVLIFYEIGLSSPSVSVLDQGIRSVLENSSFQIELYREYLETTLFPDPGAQQDIREGYLHKYRNRKPDLIIVLGISPLKFVADMHQRAFRDVPVVFGGTSTEQASSPHLGSQFTGVWDTLEPEKTLDAALRLQPGTSHVVVVGGKDAFDLELEGWFHERLRGYESSLDFRYITDLPMPQLVDTLRHLPPHTVVLMSHIGLDAAGTRFVGASQADPMVVEASNAPVFGPSDVDLGHGEVGGYLDSFASQGRDIGEMATRILKGESPKDIPVVKGTNVYTFDWRALRRWGFNEKNLPPGSIVLNRQPTLWESYKWYIVGGIFLLIAQTSLIGGLLWQRANRKKAQAAMHRSEERLRLAQQAAHIGAFEWNIRTGANVWTPELEAIYGLSPGGFLGTQNAFENLVHPDDLAGVIELAERSLKSGQSANGEWRVLWPDGSVHWIAARWQSFMDESGEPLRVVGVNMDITEHKRAEEAVKESEARFRLVADNAPVMIWMAGLDKKPTYFNQLWLDFTGLPQTELQSRLAEFVHPDDYPQCHEVYCRGFDQRQPFRKECRLRRHDGEYRWMLAIGMPRFHKDGSFAGYIGSFIDVTEHKVAQEAMSGMTRKLVEAQEQERTRIGRELHDDINQRLALLEIELEQLQDNPAEAQIRLPELRKQTSELSNDVQALSHELHSSKLEYLGVTSGIRSWCKEFGQRQKIEIDFKSDVSSVVPFEIGICLFRVLQEALHNAVKHSGEKRVEVQLAENPNEFHLIVRDSGRGFDIEVASRGRGLGLTSMRERVRLVNGTIAIDSKPMGGTIIHVRVPVGLMPETQQSAGPISSNRGTLGMSLPRMNG